jgi:membrane-bound ClpP family serine protease
MKKPSTARSANEFVEQQLTVRAEAVGAAFKSHVMAFTGPLVFGVDDIVRHVVEEHLLAGARNRSLTVMVGTFGGYIEVVQRIVETLRHHYAHINFVVPNSAFSAGTVLVLSGDMIYMNYYSRLGPIDPQVEIGRGKMVPALGYLIQYERLVKRATEGKLTLPEVQLMVEGFDQAELYKFEQARNLSITLLKRWLVRHKFKNWTQTETKKRPVTARMKQDRAEDIARQLNDTARWHTHGHGISMEVLKRDLKLKIEDYGRDPSLKEPIENYHGLLNDYMMRLGSNGAIHTPGTYLPFM